MWNIRKFHGGLEEFHGGSGEFHGGSGGGEGKSKLVLKNGVSHSTDIVEQNKNMFCE